MWASSRGLFLMIYLLQKVFSELGEGVLIDPSLCVRAGGWRFHTRASLSLPWGGSAGRMDVCLKTPCSPHPTSLCSTRTTASAESPGKGRRWEQKKWVVKWHVVYAGGSEASCVQNLVVMETRHWGNTKRKMISEKNTPRLDLRTSDIFMRKYSSLTTSIHI